MCNHGLILTTVIYNLKIRTNWLAKKIVDKPWSYLNLCWILNELDIWHFASVDQNFLMGFQTYNILMFMNESSFLHSMSICLDRLTTLYIVLWFVGNEVVP